MEEKSELSEINAEVSATEVLLMNQPEQSQEDLCALKWMRPLSYSLFKFVRSIQEEGGDIDISDDERYGEWLCSIHVDNTSLDTMISLDEDEVLASISVLYGAYHLAERKFPELCVYVARKNCSLPIGQIQTRYLTETCEVRFLSTVNLSALLPDEADHRGKDLVNPRFMANLLINAEAISSVVYPDIKKYIFDLGGVEKNES